MYISYVRAAPAVLLHNPNFFPIPSELAKAMVLIDVMHYDFEGKIRRGQIIVHELAMPAVLAFFRLAFQLRFPIHSVIPINFFGWIDEFSCAANNSSGFNMRNIEGTLSLLALLSKHAIGCAFDINPRINGCLVKHEKSLMFQRMIPANGTYNPGTPGTLFEEHPLVQLMLSYKWVWGGKWKFPVDNQHFQFVPEELAKFVTGPWIGI